MLCSFVQQRRAMLTLFAVAACLYLLWLRLVFGVVIVMMRRIAQYGFFFIAFQLPFKYIPLMFGFIEIYIFLTTCKDIRTFNRQHQEQKMKTDIVKIRGQITTI